LPERPEVAIDDAAPPGDGDAGSAGPLALDVQATTDADGTEAFTAPAAEGDAVSPPAVSAAEAVEDAASSALGEAAAPPDGTVPASAETRPAIHGASPPGAPPDGADEASGSAEPAGDPAGAAAAPDPAEPDIETILVTDQAVRIAEALLFASDRPVQPARLQQVLPEGQQAAAVLAELAARLAGRGVVLVEAAGGVSLRTAPDLAPALTRVIEVPKRLPRAAMEALAVIAWHQPVTRAEIEEIRGASLSQSSLEVLLDNGLVAPRGHREVPGRPTLWGTTPRFLEQFGLASLRELPKREELVSFESAPVLSAAAPSADRAGDGAV
jgi:segregation and condensation protein B